MPKLKNELCINAKYKLKNDSFECLPSICNYMSFERNITPDVKKTSFPTKHCTFNQTPILLFESNLGLVIGP